MRRLMMVTMRRPQYKRSQLRRHSKLLVKYRAGSYPR
jgi:hypothetical protein